VFVVAHADGAAHALYYHAATNRFFRSERADAEHLGRQLDVAPDRSAILLASVLWRTVQRYGARGYRYCLLDAGHVARSLLSTASAFGGVASASPSRTTLDVQNALHLECGEALLLTMVVRTVGQGSASTMTGTLPLPRAPAGVEYPPTLSPTLRRSINFHLASLKHDLAATPSAFDEPTAPVMRSTGQSRRSAKDFTGDELPLEALASVRRIYADFRPPIRDGAPRLGIWVVPVRIRNRACGLSEFHFPAGTIERDIGGTAAELAARLSRASQGQALIQGIAFFVAVVARRGEIVALDHRGYRHMTLNAGALCADFYEAAAADGLGTTSIGGFYDEELTDMMRDPSLHPLVVQVFGVPRSGATKVDRARLVVVRHTTNTKGMNPK
jgi:nitroreductase